MALFRNGAFVDDEWQFVDADAPLPAAGAIVLGKERYLAERAVLEGRADPLGLVLQTGETLEGLEQDVRRFALIVLDIPKYNDGRHYSTARILRDRLGYRGELRAQGDVLRDQINALHRSGFDALEVKHEGTIEALRTGAVVFVRDHYQPASLEGEEVHLSGLRRRLRVTQGDA
ncbi:DUF934 domain-containing protein [Pseudochelatococcus contaminans]|uniref:Uncharacterized protein (DUF934 family) n=1 Tax=Pseudochelatococcus contaminans TaxID=1538103 RepID=A0A7W5Z6E2_9HYPH|nr:DUF934 domain-containing protein [Pseudochelatococcus contaminans]MBB3810839.1 uncharacterized protein (DUF934 family) [Pseudochelatococcus contaminans]